MTINVGEFASEESTQPGQPGQPDQWAATASGAGNVAAAGLPSGRQEPLTGIAFKPIHAVVAVFFVLAAIAQTTWLFVGKATILSDNSISRYPNQATTNAVVIALYLVIAAFVLSRRSREFGLALALALPVSFLLANMHDLRPSNYFGAFAPSGQYLFGIAKLCILAGGFTAGLEWRWRSLATPRTPASSPRRDVELLRRQRLLCLLAGVFGIVPFAIGLMIDSMTITVAGVDRSETCCTFAQRSGWEKADAIGFVAVLALFVVFAAIDRSRARSVAWLLAPTLLGVANILGLLAELAWPAQSFLGDTSLDLRISLIAGFWLQLLGTLVLLAAAAIRSGLDKAAAEPYRPTRA